MPQSYDVIVAGCGVMGASISRHLAGRGAKVLGLDRHSPPHTMGSSHGRTRLIREAYYEHPLYVPLVRRSYELWRDLESAIGESLLTKTGSIMIGPAASELVAGTIQSAQGHSVPHEVLDSRTIATQFPAFAPSAHWVGVFEPGSSLLSAERCVAGLTTEARSTGAEFRWATLVKSWKCSSTGVEVSLNNQLLAADVLVLSAGAWNRDLAPEALDMLRIERQVQHWWTPARHRYHFQHDRMPVSMWQFPDGRIFYTMPDMGEGLKLGWHHNGSEVDPDAVVRESNARDRADMEELLARFLPDGKGQQTDSAICFYTNTPDGHFIIDRHPEHQRVWIVSACSGHGFKFAPVIGEIVADLITGRQPAFDIFPFRHGRFSAP